MKEITFYEFGVLAKITGCLECLNIKYEITATTDANGFSCKILHVDKNGDLLRVIDALYNYLSKN